MSIFVYPDVLVPNGVVLAGINGRATRQNERTRNQGGYATANVVRDVTLREYTLGAKPMLTSLWAQILGLYEITDAGAYGMLLEDPADSVCSAAEGLVTLTSGAWQMFKRYRAAGSTRYRDRRITRPKAGATIYRNGVAMSSGYTLDVATGVLTITAPGADAFTWSGAFYVPVQFTDDAIEWDLVRPGRFAERLIAGPSIALREVRE